MLSHAPADIVRHALINYGQGTLPSSNGAWPIFVFQEPDIPDDAVTVYDTSGKVEGRHHNDGEVCQHEGIQIRVRSASPLDGNTKLRSIVEACDKQLINIDVSIAKTDGTGTAIYRLNNLSRTGTILSLGKDSPGTKRSLFTINYLLSVRQTS